MWCCPDDSEVTLCLNLTFLPKILQSILLTSRLTLQHSVRVNLQSAPCSAQYSLYGTTWTRLQLFNHLINCSSIMKERHRELVKPGIHPPQGHYLKSEGSIHLQILFQLVLMCAKQGECARLFIVNRRVFALCQEKKFHRSSVVGKKKAKSSSIKRK